jgi:hypothetical protein
MVTTAPVPANLCVVAKCWAVGTTDDGVTVTCGWVAWAPATDDKLLANASDTPTPEAEASNLIIKASDLVITVGSFIRVKMFLTGGSRGLGPATPRKKPAGLAHRLLHRAEGGTG